MSLAMVDEVLHTVPSGVTRVSAVVLAGGQGERFGSWIPKPFMSLNGRAVIDWSLQVLDRHVGEIIVVSDWPYKHYGHAKPGRTRSESARNGFYRCDGDWIIIHDAVRPFLTDRIMTDMLEALQTHPVVDTAVPVVDGMLVDGTPVSKTGFMLGQTPEGFHRDVLEQAFASTQAAFDDEVSMVYAALGIRPHVIPGVSLNTKLTVAEDLAHAEGLTRLIHNPVLEASGRTPRTLILGGSGDIGSALTDLLDDFAAPPRADLDLDTDWWELNLDGFGAVVHTAGTVEHPWPVNYHSVTRLLHQAEQQQWTGRIVVLSSTAATYGRPGAAEYCASKAAVNSYLESEHDRLATHGIIVNAVAPAKVAGRLQHSLNPDADTALMLTPTQVAERIIPYLTTSRHGVVDYMRVGL